MRQFLVLLTLCLAIAAGAQTPTVAAIVDRHIAAAGGRAAIERVRTRVSKGEVVTPAGRVPFALYQAAPSRFLTIVDAVGGAGRNGFDGTIAWSDNPNGRKEVTGPEAGMIRREYDIRWALRFADTYPTATVLPDTTIDGRRFTRIDAPSADGVHERLSFDATTGLLTRREILAPFQFVFESSDYRQVGGVLVPYSVKHSRGDFYWTNRFTTIDDGIPLSDTLFTRPRP